MKDTIWSQDYLEAASKAKTVNELYCISIEAIASTHKKDIHMVIGPMTTGGAGNLDLNMARHKKVVEHFLSQGICVFDQSQIDDDMSRIIDTINIKGYPWLLFEDFFGPLFESGIISKLHLLPDWETSTGTKWEHEKARSLGIELNYLTEDFVASIE